MHNSKPPCHFSCSRLFLAHKKRPALSGSACLSALVNARLFLVSGTCSRFCFDWPSSNLCALLLASPRHAYLRVAAFLFFDTGALRFSLRNVFLSIRKKKVSSCFFRKLAAVSPFQNQMIFAQPRIVLLHISSKCHRF